VHKRSFSAQSVPSTNQTELKGAMVTNTASARMLLQVASILSPRIPSLNFGIARFVP
jgi:hypothetical protein